MKETKRLVALLIAVIMLVGIMAGCGKTADPAATSQSATPTASASESAAPAEAAKKPAELTLWVNVKDESEFDKGMREEFIAQNPHIKLNVIDKTGDTNTEFAVAFAAGAAPSVQEISGPMFRKYVKNDFFVPMDDYINSWEEKDTHVDTFKEIGVRDGKTYGLVTFLGPIMFGYNKALFKEAGLEAPKTWDDMINAAVKLTDRSKNQYGYSMLANDWLDWFFQFYVWQAGGDITKTNPDGTIELQFTSPAVVKACELYRDLKWKHKVIQNDITLSFDDMVKEFATGKSAMMIFAPDWVPWVSTLGMKIEDLGIIPMPAGPSGQLITSTGVSMVGITNSGNKDTQDAAWEWIKYRFGRDYITKRLKDQEKKGVVPPQVMIYKDMKQSDITPLDPAWEEALATGAGTGRDEYAGKEVLTKYIVAAVQKVIVEENTDIVAELQAQQEIAQKEVVDRYNADKLSGK